MLEILFALKIFDSVVSTVRVVFTVRSDTSKFAVSFGDMFIDTPFATACLRYFFIEFFV